MTRAVGNLVINAYKHNDEGNQVGIMVRKDAGRIIHYCGGYRQGYPERGIRDYF